MMVLYGRNKFGNSFNKNKHNGGVGNGFRYSDRTKNSQKNRARSSFYGNGIDKARMQQTRQKGKQVEAGEVGAKSNSCNALFDITNVKEYYSNKSSGRGYKKLNNAVSTAQRYHRA
ncbi:hypothetical protein ACOSP7_031289 [Xanthoceras sorbifolium]